MLSTQTYLTFNNNIRFYSSRDSFLFCFLKKTIWNGSVKRNERKITLFGGNIRPLKTFQHYAVLSLRNNMNLKLKIKLKTVVKTGTRSGLWHCPYCMYVIFDSWTAECTHKCQLRALYSNFLFTCRIIARWLLKLSCWKKCFFLIICFCLPHDLNSPINRLPTGLPPLFGDTIYTSRYATDYEYGKRTDLRSSSCQKKIFV